MTASASIVERLRAGVPACPFENKETCRDIEPSDPCPVCGGLGTDESEDLCSGGQRILFNEAADFIDRQSRIIAAHEQQVKDGSDEIDRLQHDIERHVAIIAEKDAEIAIKERAIAEAARLMRKLMTRALAAESSRDAAVEAEREACALVCDEMGAREQEGYGLTRGAQNYFRARNAIRSRAQTAREDGGNSATS